MDHKHNRHESDEKQARGKIPQLLKLSKEKRASTQKLQTYSFIHPSFHIKCLAASEFERFNIDDKPGEDCIQVCA